jgi:hypothetical protein
MQIVFCKGDMPTAAFARGTGEILPPLTWMDKGDTKAKFQALRLTSFPPFSLDTVRQLAAKAGKSTAYDGHCRYLPQSVVDSTLKMGHSYRSKHGVRSSRVLRAMTQTQRFLFSPLSLPI